MNIAFLISNLSNSGGTQRMLCTLSNILVDHFKITILVHHGEKSFFPLDQRINVVNLSNTSTGILKKNWEIYKILKKRKIKYYINLDSNSIILNGFILPRFTNLILWEHFSISNNYKKLLFTLSRNYAVYKCKKLILISDYELAAWKKYNFLSKKKSYKIYNPLSINTTKIDNSNRLNLKTFLAIGNNIEVKGFDILLDSWSRQRSDWKLCIVGLTDEELKKLQLSIKKNNLKNIEVFGKVNNIDTYYRQASAFLLTSRKEATPLVLIESQAYGLPAIVFNHLPGVLELINDSALIVNFIEKDQGFANSINQLTEDKILYEKLHQNALKNAEKFNSETFKKEWLNILL